MNPNEVVVSTITLARDDVESQTIQRGLRMLSSKGFPAIVVADGGSGDEFAATIHAIPGVTLVPPSQPGLQGQVLTSLRSARDLGRDYILYTEPNKPQFFQDKLDVF